MLRTISNAFLLLIFICSPLCAHAADGNDPKPDFRVKIQLIDALKKYLDIQYLSGQEAADAVTCTPTPPTPPQACTVNVPVRIVSISLATATKGAKKDDVESVDYCIARFPKEISFTTTPGSVAQITWVAVPEAGTPTDNYAFRFHDTPALLVSSDSEPTETAPVLGSVGEGHNAKSLNKFHLTHLLAPKGQSTYLPILLQVSTSNPDQIGVCATGDPRIVND